MLDIDKTMVLKLAISTSVEQPMAREQGRG